MALSGKIEPKITKYLFQKAVMSNTPLSGTFELSPCCNMNCKMCYVRRSRAEVDSAGGEITADRWIELGKQCRDAGTLYMLLTGGEPFLYKDFKKVYIELHNMGMQVSINTNGTLITDEEAGWLREHGPETVNITIYGASNETYERVGGHKYGFDRMISAVRKLKDSGIKVKFNCSLTPYNCMDYKKMSDIANELGIYMQTSYYMFPPIRKENMSFGQADRFDIKTAAMYGMKMGFLRYGYDGFAEKRRQYLEVMNGNSADRVYLTDEENPEGCGQCPEEPLGCRAGRASYWINWHGIMTPCGMMNGPEAYPLRDGFSEAWKQTVENTKKLHIPPKCTTCKDRKNCIVCGAMAFNETGGYDEAPRYICGITRQINEYMKMDYRELYKEVME